MWNIYVYLDMRTCEYGCTGDDGKHDSMELCGLDDGLGDGTCVGFFQ